MNPETLGFHPVLGAPAAVYGETFLAPVCDRDFGGFLCGCPWKKGWPNDGFLSRMLPVVAANPGFSFQLVGGLEISRGRCEIISATTGTVLLSQISDPLPQFAIFVLQWNDGIGRGSLFGLTGLILANHRLLTKAPISASSVSGCCIERSKALANSVGSASCSR